MKGKNLKYTVKTRWDKARSRKRRRRTTTTSKAITTMVTKKDNNMSGGTEWFMGVKENDKRILNEHCKRTRVEKLADMKNA